MPDVTFNFSGQKPCKYEGRLRVPLFVMPYAIDSTLADAFGIQNNAGKFPSNWRYRQTNDIAFSVAFRHLTPFSQTLWLYRYPLSGGFANTAWNFISLGDAIFGIGRTGFPSSNYGLNWFYQPLRQGLTTNAPEFLYNMFDYGVNYSVGFGTFQNSIMKILRRDLNGFVQACMAVYNVSGVQGRFFTYAPANGLNTIRQFPDVFSSSSIRLKANIPSNRLGYNVTMCGASTATRPRYWNWETDPSSSQIKNLNQFEAVVDVPALDTFLSSNATNYFTHPYGFVIASSGLYDGLPAWFFISDDGSYIYQLDFYPANFTPVGAFMTSGTINVDEAGTIYRYWSGDSTRVFASFDPTEPNTQINARYLQFQPPSPLVCVPCNYI